MIKEAKLIKDISENFAGHACLYKLLPPLDGKINYVIVSTAFAPYSGVETYIFPATSRGKIKDWGELDGSQRGTSSHSEVLESAGYTLC